MTETERSNCRVYLYDNTSLCLFYVFSRPIFFIGVCKANLHFDKLSRSRKFLKYVKTSFSNNLSLKLFQQVSWRSKYLQQTFVSFKIFNFVLNKIKWNIIELHFGNNQSTMYIIEFGKLTWFGGLILGTITYCPSCHK